MRAGARPARPARPVRLVGAVVGAVVVAVVSAACTQADAVKVPVMPAGAVRGGTLVVGIAPPASLEPSNAVDPASRLIVSTMCDTLAQADAATGALRPALAAGWQIGGGGSRFTITLRKGLRFSNGQKVTPADVVYSLSRAAKADYAGELAPLLEPVLGYEVIHGDVESKSAEAARELAGVKAVDSQSFEIRLKRKNADFIRILAHQIAAPVPKSLVEKDGDAFARQPVCAGPYRLDRAWAPGATTISLSRNRQYAAKNAGLSGGGAGYADKIEFRVIADPAARVAAFQRGELDVAQVAPEQLPAAAQLGAQLVTAANGYVDLIGVPAKDKVLARPDVRRALSLALDRRALVQQAFAGGRLPATGLLPPTVGAAARRDPCAASVPAAGDVDGAKRTLAAAGVDLTGVPLKLTVNDELGNGPLADAVARQWHDRLGLAVTVERVPWTRYAQVRQGAAAFDNPFHMGWAPPYASLDGYLSPLFNSSQIGLNNLVGFSDPAVDEGLDKRARTAADDTARALEYLRVAGFVCASMPVIPIAFGTAKQLVHKERWAAAGDRYALRATGAPNLRELYRRP